ncbi:unnamed protein product, partial [Vitis vinifera]|uniref:Uncharacterized protein n=1 Tax=Vitis vinifera TaxID=29760 RepID=D7SYY0_VITVI
MHCGRYVMAGEITKIHKEKKQGKTLFISVSNNRLSLDLLFQLGVFLERELRGRRLEVYGDQLWMPTSMVTNGCFNDLEL